jgi:hypothetical protein
MMTLGALALVAAGCDSGSTSDPATVTRSELNPPTGLVSVTDKDGLELRWDAANAEDELQGYDVFVIKSTLATVKGNAPAFPKNITPTPTLDGGAFPRCLDNTKLFEAFGFNATDKDCKGDADKKDTTTPKTVALLDDGTGAAKEPAEKLANFVPCATGSTADMSLAAAAKPVLSQQVCKVTKYYDPASKSLKDMVAGETYVAFVATIAGDDKSTMSWTSNFVEDAPNARLFDDTLTIAKGGTLHLPLAKLTAFTGTITKADWAADDCETTVVDDSVCRINKTNSTFDDGLWLGRLGSGDFPQRLFFSTKSGGAVATQLRGPQTIDPKEPAKISYTIPGDEATDTYVNVGTLFPVYGNQVFDLKVTSGGVTNYGKVVFYSAEPLPTDAAADYTMRVVVIMQPAAGSFHYLN